MAVVLAVDDEMNVRELLTDLLEAQGHLVLTASCVEEAVEVVRSRQVDVLLTDVSMPGPSGLTLLSRLAAERPEVIRIVVSGRATPGDRRGYIAAGADAVLPKPFSLHELTRTIDGEISRRRVPGIVGISPAMERLRTHVHRVADSPTTVIVTGASGVGKELVARAIHDLSSRSDKPFVPVHCGALSPHLLESELFGHVRGAFTDAVADRQGCFERAEGGTLFLDEVGTMSLETQVRLLRVLQERVVTRVGAGQQKPIDVRVLAATNEPLEKLLADGRFREDLYYRLNVFRIDIAPLRERRADILPLTRHFLSDFGAGAFPVEIGDCARDALLSHSWPGNARELRNVIERALILATDEGTLRASHLQLRASGPVPEGAPMFTLPDEGVSLPDLVSRLERDLIIQSLTRVGGSRAEAARLLGLKRTTLVQKIKRANLDSMPAA